MKDMFYVCKVKWSHFISTRASNNQVLVREQLVNPLANRESTKTS